MEIYLKGITTALKGAPTTLSVSLIAVVIGFALGVGLSLMKSSRHKVLRGISTTYIEIVRGTPLLVQALIFAYGLPQIFEFSYPRYVLGVPGLIIPAILVCGLNSAAYMAEVIRGGIDAVPKGQIEAGLAIGMKRRQVMRHIVLPQAFRIVLPSLGNEFVTLIKETSVLSYVGVVEVLRQASLWSASSFEYFPAYIGAAVVYLLMTFPLSKLVRYAERRLSGQTRKQLAKEGKC